MTIWRRNGAALVNSRTGERLLYSVGQVLALLLEKPQISIERADALHCALSLAERQSCIAGNLPGVGRAAYLATLSEIERDAVTRFAAGEEW